jgi:hypothetical protein
MRRSLVGFAIGVVAAGSAFSQYVISAHSGVVQLVEGRAYLNDTLVEGKFGQFPDIKENQEFRTEEGRAEILLTPGVFLRIGESSSIRMLSTRLSDTRVEILSGSAMVECEDIPKDNAIVLVHNGTNMLLVKHGLYRVDSDPARFKVYDGEAIVKAESGQLTLRSGKETALGGALMASSFDKNDTDALYNWSARRASYVAQANASSANVLRNGGGFYNGFYSDGFAGYNGFGAAPFGNNGAWQYNSMFGLYTWVPYQGLYASPFGYNFWSPGTVGYYTPVAGGYSVGRTPIPVSTIGGAARASSLGSGAGASRGGGFSSVASAGGHSGGGHR